MNQVLIHFLLLLFIGLSTHDSLAISTKQIDRIMSSYAGQDPGAIAMVVEKGKVVYQRGFGVSNLKTRTRIDGDTSFRLASLTKQFTAFAVLLLVDRGNLKLETRLHEIFPKFPRYGKDIRLKHLLFHQSGLRRYEKNVPRSMKGPLSDAKVLRILSGLNSKLSAAGVRYKYSNSGYSLLASIVEEVSGKSFSQFLKQEIFDPLRMDSAVAHVEGKTVVTNRAFGYTKINGRYRKTDQNIYSSVLGDGGIYMSANDFFLWDQSLRSPQLLSAKYHKMLGEASRLKNGARTSYAMGWRVGKYRGKRLWHHTGSSIGFKNIVLRFPNEEITILLLSNRSQVKPNKKAYAIADVLLDKL